MTTTEPEIRTYGNFRRPESPGLGSLGTLGTALVFGGLIVLIILMAAHQLIASAAWAVGVCVVLVLLMVRDLHHRTGLERFGARMAWRRSRKLGQHLYRSGPLGRTEWGTCQLPGLLAASKLHEFTDSYGRPFAIVEMPQVGHYSVVISTEPDGSQLVDQEQVDSWVAHWGNWLSGLGQELGLVGAAVTVEAAPDSGARLRREVLGRIDPDASDLAKRVLRRVAMEYPTGSAQVRAWVTLTFNGRTYAGRRRTVDEVARDLGSRMPALTQQLGNTGAGAARPASALAVCEAVRVAYDPAAAALIDEVHARGETPSLDWSDVGPAAVESTWDAMRHDSAWSRTWMMTSAPRGEVYSSVLAKLISAHPDLDRKRVTLLYRPLDAARAARAVEQDKRTADLRVNSARRPSDRNLTSARSARSAAAEEARGAGLVDFGMLITATVTEEERLPEARAAVESLAATARLVIRPVYGSQDAAFAAALPLGAVLSSHLRVPESLRRAM